MTPPKALCGSVDSAPVNASPTDAPTAQPQGLLCLMIAAAGTSNSSISRRPESRSSRLLNDSSLPCSFDTIDSRSVREPGLGVVRRALVRVLAVGQVEHLLERARVLGREVLLALGEPARDRGVVARGVAERLGGEALARALGEPALALAQLVQHGVVGLGRDDHRRVLVVLRRRADQRGAADVDVLDHLLLGTPRRAGRARTDRGSRRPGRSARSRARRACRRGRGSSAPRAGRRRCAG